MAISLRFNSCFCFSMLLEITLGIGAAILIRHITKKHEKTNGIYSQPGLFYPIKWIIFYVFYRRRTKQALNRQQRFDHGSDLRFLEDNSNVSTSKLEDVGSGVRWRMPPEIMERTQPVADSKFAIDAIYFNGFEMNNPTIADDVSLVMGFTNRFRDFAEILFFLHVPGVGFLQHPSHPDRIICDSTATEYQYQGQGMVLEMLEPMRRWRIKYNGLMRVMDVNDRHVSKKSDKLIHVKFSFIWRSYTGVADYDTDISPSCMARAFASEEWTREFFNKVNRTHSHQSHYEQWGQLQGVLQVENEEPKELMLRGMRDHSFSRRDWKQFHRYILNMIYLEDGTSIAVGALCLDNTITRLTMGYIIHPNHIKESIDYVDMRLWEHGENGKIPREVVFNFTAGGKKYNVVSQIRIIPEFYNGFEWESKLMETLSDFYVNGVPGRGITEFCYRQSHDLRLFDDCTKSETKLFKEADLIDSSNIFTLDLEDELCQMKSLVGGKGSQVATLTNWAKENDKFSVPSGFCITTNVYQRYIEENAELQDLLKNLELEISTYSTDQLKDLCQRIMDSIETSNVNEEMAKLIGERYLKIIHNKSPLVAVRSSGIGEDTIDLSAAGQLETFLGVSGIDSVIEHIKKCWAGQYRYCAVEYRRLHGQPVLSTMGILIQTLAENTKTSGVLFTQNPVTGHPLHSLINCNYGLGETVVSGAAEPDTILVEYSQNNNPKIIKKNVGTKKKMTKVNGNGTVEEVDVEAKQCSEICLTEREILDLVEVGHVVQTYSGSARDIEWAISNDGKISLVQSRPITGDPTETDFEIEHEFDSAVSNDDYLFTTANIGEMMPGPITPLTNSMFLRSMEYGLQMFFENAVARGPFWFNDVIVISSHGHLFLNYMEMCRTNENSVTTHRKDSLDVNLFGKICEQVSLQKVKKYHGCANLFGRLWNAVKFYRWIYNAERDFDNLVERCKDFRLHGENAKSLYKLISDNVSDIYAEAWKNYIAYATASGTSTTVLMMILSQGKADWKTEHYSDVAMIHGSCENPMESVDAPTLLERTAKLLHESEDKEKFLSLEPEDAIKWLISHKGESGRTFRKLLQDCGHRCIRESELREKSWANEPGKLGVSLQTAVAHFAVKKPKVALSTEDTIANIKTPLSFFARSILKFAIPKARKAVAGRENGKSKIIKIADAFKQGYWRLANLLEKEGYLPEADLAFFLTHGEIGRLLRNRSPRLIYRANKRRKFYNKALHFHFDEFQERFPPKPVNLNAELTPANIDFTLHGFPVSHGTVEGSARIVSNLEDAHNIQKGDILIVRTTDVGWSPYFPLISGLVTEIGGLISHGATVAREFGLPCIVGAKKATQVFKSGDYVSLDGGQGLIRKLGATT